MYVFRDSPTSDVRHGRAGEGEGERDMVVRRKLARRLFLFRGVVHHQPYSNATILPLIPPKEITRHLIAQRTHHTIPYRTIPATHLD
jgi:hypothetical protein